MPYSIVPSMIHLKADPPDAQNMSIWDKRSFEALYYEHILWITEGLIMLEQNNIFCWSIPLIA